MAICSAFPISVLEAYYREGNHNALISEFPVWLESTLTNVAPETDLAIIRALSLYLTLLSEFGLAAESRLLPKIEEYLGVFNQLNSNNKLAIIPDSLFEKHVVILLDGYGATDVARNEYYSFCRDKEKSNQTIGDGLSQLFHSRIPQQNDATRKHFDLNSFFGHCKRWIKRRFGSTNGVSILVSFLLILLILSWIRRNIPRFWARVLSSCSYLAYSLLTPI